jgi:Flp pilus assembly protein TadD
MGGIPSCDPAHTRPAIRGTSFKANPLSGREAREPLVGDSREAAFESSVTFYNRGLILERQGRNDEAAAAYAEAVRLDPGDVDAQVRLGLVLRDLGRDEEANRAFLTALDLKRAASFTPHRDSEPEP